MSFCWCTCQQPETSRTDEPPEKTSQFEETQQECFEELKHAENRDAVNNKDLKDNHGVAETDAPEDFVGSAATDATKAKLGPGELLKEFRVYEAADGIDELSCQDKESMELQLGALSQALGVLSCHADLEKAAALTRFPSNISLPSSTSTNPPSNSNDTTPSSSSSWFNTPSSKPSCDKIDMTFDLDESHKLEATVEFFPDGKVALQWKAAELAVPLHCVVCLVQEIDLLCEIAPFVESSCVLHQFDSPTDRIVRVVSKPPMLPRLEAVAQRFGFDMLSTEWGGLCLVETAPKWETPPGNPANACPSWRGVPKPPPTRKGIKEVDVKTVTALAQPAGQKGEKTTIFFCGKGDLKIPRSMLPNWVVTWLVKLIGRHIYQKALAHVAAFETSESEHGKRMRASAFYTKLQERIEEILQMKMMRAGG